MPLTHDVSISVRKMEDRILIVGRYRGGGYEKDFNLDNAILSPSGICRTINAHVSKGSPPIVIIEKEEGKWKTDSSSSGDS